MDNPYLASFFTELGAVEFLDCVRKLGDDKAYSVPAPRKISVSCGTAVTFSIEFDESKMNNPDLDSIYRIDGDKYIQLWSQDD